VPEGDTIHRAAARLRTALQGREVVRFEVPRLIPPFPATGSTIERIEARGKHLVVWSSDGLVLHTHLGMPGSWHLYRPGEPWQRGPGQVRAVVEVADAVAVCFNAPTVEVLDAGAVERHPALRRLGPDLTAPDPDLDLALERMARIPAPGTPVADVLLDQRVASGIGNVYKSDVCFLHGLDPRTPLSVVPEATRRSLLADASRLLQANLTTARRTTVPGAPDGTVWVYGREGRPCRRCRTPIRYATVGVHARGTYWCPRCQPPAGGT
jgi:endonuclease-8